MLANCSDHKTIIEQSLVDYIARENSFLRSTFDDRLYGHLVEAMFQLLVDGLYTADMRPQLITPDLLR